MKINGINRITQLYNVQQNSQSKKIQKTNRKDTVQVSTKGREVQVLKNALKEVPDIRTEKVEHIKAQMKSNQYNIDAREVAKKMFESGFDFKI